MSDTIHPYNFIFLGYFRQIWEMERRKKRGTSKLCSLSKVLIHRLQKFHSVTRQLSSQFKKKGWRKQLSEFTITLQDGIALHTRTHRNDGFCVDERKRRRGKTGLLCRYQNGTNAIKRDSSPPPWLSPFLSIICLFNKWKMSGTLV